MFALSSSTPISFSSHLGRSWVFSSFYCSRSSFFFSLPRFPSLSSLGRKCIRPPYEATWVRFSINIHHSTGEQQGEKKDASLLFSLQKPPFLLERRERESPDLRDCLPASSWQPSLPTLTLELHCLGS